MIDIYTHILPRPFSEALGKVSPRLGNIAARLQGVRALHDLEARFRAMDEVPGYAQVISLPNPPLEDIVSAPQAADLARIANDAMAGLCARHPERFPAFVATLSLLDPEDALREADRAITTLGARGVQIFTNVAGKPLDLPEYQPLFAAMAGHDLPVWLHPARTADMTDYASEPKSRFEMWWCFGWPYETSVAMARLVLSGLFDRHPALKIITHHGGGMIPTFDGRVGPGMAVLGSRTTDEDLSGILPALRRPHLDYFRDFYADTAMFGSATGLPASLAFFGHEHLVFSTDAPFGPIAETLTAIASLGLDDAGKEAVMRGNAERLLRLTPAAQPQQSGSRMSGA
ncbi:amidohydrolase [Roseomonas sp. KE2513]|uniref:amidohydrolase family protein n=1 Tax=Roseomonas sp. KE2513 TaxID=2479202 RepID=UPI0018DF1542|nr:amidohydrolase family protein [Roseomonas sp. KE2513]MBI0537848.1 amidohydrolase [Roseomonas sp. KE2513]